MDAVSRFRDPPVKTAIGIGGPHYNSKFTRMALESEMAFGHMIPKYAVSSLDSMTLGQCVERTLERVEYAVLDWKGVRGQDKQPLIQLLAGAGMAFEKV
jgi:D-aminoacyl-tRNA deacylase